MGETHWGPPPPFIQAVRRVLKPLVRAMIAQGLTHRQLSDLLKGVFVEVAENTLAVDGRRPTDSGVSLATGVHRKDVRRLRRAGTPPAPAPADLGARIRARWSTDPRYLDTDGQPRALERRAADGTASFHELVESVGKDLRPRSVLDEWRRAGLVRLDAQGRVCLEARTSGSGEGFAERARSFATNLHDHAATAAHNLCAGAPPLLECAVLHSGLSADAAARLGESARAHGMAALLAVDGEARQYAGPGGRRVSFGVYFHSETETGNSEGDS